MENQLQTLDAGDRNKLSSHIKTDVKDDVIISNQNIECSDSIEINHTNTADKTVTEYNEQSSQYLVNNRLPYNEVSKQNVDELCFLYPDFVQLINKLSKNKNISEIREIIELLKDDENLSPITKSNEKIVKNKLPDDDLTDYKTTLNELNDIKMNKQLEICPFAISNGRDLTSSAERIDGSEYGVSCINNTAIIDDNTKIACSNNQNNSHTLSANGVGKDINKSMDINTIISEDNICSIDKIAHNINDHNGIITSYQSKLQDEVPDLELGESGEKLHKFTFKNLKFSRKRKQFRRKQISLGHKSVINASQRMRFKQLCNSHLFFFRNRLRKKRKKIIYKNKSNDDVLVSDKDVKQSKSEVDVDICSEPELYTTMINDNLKLENMHDYLLVEDIGGSCTIDCDYREKELPVDPCRQTCTNTVLSNTCCNQSNNSALSSNRHRTISKTSSDSVNDELKILQLLDLYKCTMKKCSFSTNKRQSLMKHFVYHHGGISEILSCIYCGEVCAQFDGLCSHIKEIHGSCQYQCLYCYYRAVLPCLVLWHQNCYHTNKSVRILLLNTEMELPQIDQISVDRWKILLFYKCALCEKTKFITGEKFLLHNSIVHGKMKYLPCYICNGTFPCEQLVSHFMEHQVEEFQCTYCLTCGITESEIKMHLVNKHSSKYPVAFRRCVKRTQTVPKFQKLIYERTDEFIVCVDMNEDVDDRLIYFYQKGRLYGAHKNNDDDDITYTFTSVHNNNNKLDNNTTIDTSSSIYGSSRSSIVTIDDDEPETPEENIPLSALLMLSEFNQSDDTVCSKNDLDDDEKIQNKLTFSFRTDDRLLSVADDKKNAIIGDNNSDNINNVPVSVLPILLTKPNSEREEDEALKYRTSPIKSYDSFITERTADNKFILNDADNQEDKTSSSKVDANYDNIYNYRRCDLSSNRQEEVLIIDSSDEEIELDNKTNEKTLDIDDKIADNRRSMGFKNRIEKKNMAGTAQVDLCSEEFLRRNNILEYNNADGVIVVSRKELYYCAVKGCQFEGKSKNELRYHLFCCYKRHKVPSLCCRYCGKNFIVISRFLDHLEIHTSSRFFCALCNFRSRSSAGLTTHMKSYHMVMFMVRIPMYQSRDDVEKDLFLMLPTKKGFWNSKDHQASANSSGGRISVKSVVYSVEDVEREFHRPLFSEFVGCGLCMIYVTKVRSNLVAHLRLHDTRIFITKRDIFNPVPCLNKNEKMFDKMRNYAAFQRKITSASQNKSSSKPIIQHDANDQYYIPCYVPENERYICSVPCCNYRALNVNILKRHYENCHSNLNYYSCPHCDSSLKSSQAVPLNELKIHFRQHDSKLYRCVYCSYSDNEKAKVMCHLAEDHPSMSALVDIIRELNTNEFDEYMKDARCTTVLTASDNDSTQAPIKVNNTRWMCNICLRNCVSVEEVKVHCKDIHRVNGRIKCTYCSLMVKKRGDFGNHFKTVHPDLIEHFVDIYSEVYLNFVILDTEEQEKEHKKSTDIETAPEMKNAEAVACDSQEITVENKYVDLSKLYGSPHGDKFCCPLCTFETESVALLTSHIFEEINYPRFVCMKCARLSTTSDQVIKHAKEVHKSGRVFRLLSNSSFVMNWICQIVKYQFSRMVTKNNEQILNELNDLIMSEQSIELKRYLINTIKNDDDDDDDDSSSSSSSVEIVENNAIIIDITDSEENVTTVTTTSTTNTDIKMSKRPARRYHKLMTDANVVVDKNKSTTQDLVKYHSDLNLENTTNNKMITSGFGANRIRCNNCYESFPSMESVREHVLKTHLKPSTFPFGSTSEQLNRYFKEHFRKRDVIKNLLPTDRNKYETLVSVNDDASVNTVTDSSITTTTINTSRNNNNNNNNTINTNNDSVVKSDSNRSNSTTGNEFLHNTYRRNNVVNDNDFKAISSLLRNNDDTQTISSATNNKLQQTKMITSFWCSACLYKTIYRSNAFMHLMDKHLIESSYSDFEPVECTFSCLLCNSFYDISKPTVKNHIIDRHKIEMRKMLNKVELYIPYSEYYPITKTDINSIRLKKLESFRKPHYRVVSPNVVVTVVDNINKNGNNNNNNNMKSSKNFAVMKDKFESCFARINDTKNEFLKSKIIKNLHYPRNDVNLIRSNLTNRDADLTIQNNNNNNNGIIDNHRGGAKKNIVSAIECPFCQYVDTRYTNIISHVESVHPDKARGFQTNNNNNNNNDDDNIFVEPEKQFTTKRKLFQHEMTNELTSTRTKKKRDTKIDNNYDDDNYQNVTDVVTAFDDNTAINNNNSNSNVIDDDIVTIINSDSIDNYIREEEQEEIVICYPDNDDYC